MEYFNFANQIAKKAGDELYRSFRKNKPGKRGTSKEVKSTFDLVADQIIVSSIENHFPNHSYFTEETGLVSKNSEYVWIIDPLDGTGNFENHNPFFSVSIALWKNGEPVLSVIEAPALKERFVAQRGRGAFHEDLLTGLTTNAQVSGISNYQDAYFIFCEGCEKDKNRIVKAFSSLYLNSKDFRKIGSAALELASVGVGRSEGYITFKIGLYDIAAGILFLSEAGGEIMDFSKKKISFNQFNLKDKFDIVATNGHIDMIIDHNL